MSWSVLLMQVMEKWEASEHLGASSRSLTLERRLRKLADLAAELLLKAVHASRSDRGRSAAVLYRFVPSIGTGTT